MLISMSQEALGERLDLTFQQVQKYEKGQNRIGASRLHQIARELGVPVSFFFEGLPENGEPASDAPSIDPQSFVASPEGLQLNLAFQQIGDAATRRKIVDLVQTLATATAS
jgi:transcriptional regulator with XRE-family HTH domain